MAAVAAGAVVASTVAVVAATLIGVGDIRLDGPVGDIARRGGYERPVAGIKDLLAGDIVLGNLECPVSTRGEKQPKTWNFRAPPKNLKILQLAGFTALNVANNHSFDYGLLAFHDTLKEVRKAGFTLIGGGKDRADAEKVRVIDVGGLRVGLLGMTSTFPTLAWAKTNRAGVLYSDFDRIPAVIKAAKEKSDVLVVSFHGGTELDHVPNEIQKAVMRLAADSGADLVLGHHPHVLQPVELRDGKPIVYSLGNFLFVSPSTGTRVTAIARAHLSKEGVKKLEFVPVDTNWGTPVPATPEQAEEAKKELNGLGAFDERPDLLEVVSQ